MLQQWLTAIDWPSSTAEWALVLFGFTAQAVFMSRFLVQWYVSERRGKSTVPVIFWWLSLAGGLMLGFYALLRGDPVFLAGQGLGVAIYVRNLVLIYRRRTRLRRRRDGQDARPPVALGKPPLPASSPAANLNGSE